MSKKNDQRYRIRIRNWDNYQSELKGMGDRRTRRHWIAISVHLSRDPDFLALTIEQRYTWLMLLCHAGAVGPEFELSPSDARLLFKLRRSADFSVFENQGFIDLEIPTNKVGRDTNKDILPDQKPKPKNWPKKWTEQDETQFDYFKKQYPKRGGGQPWVKTRHAIHARLEENHQWKPIIDGVTRYAQFCADTNKIGTEFVMMAATFCGPDLHFNEPWTKPKDSMTLSQANRICIREAKCRLTNETDDLFIDRMRTLA